MRWSLRVALAGRGRTGVGWIVSDGEPTGSNPVRPHPCHRCGDVIEPGHVYGALDLLDADGELTVLLCRPCSAALRDFLE